LVVGCVAVNQLHLQDVWQPQLLYVVVGGGGKPTAGDVAV
jgi:hypothetical protein